jgi:hypothetical protein
LIQVLLLDKGACYLQVYIDQYHMLKERLNRSSHMVASSVASLIYKPLVLEPGLLVLVGSLQYCGLIEDRISVTLIP